LLASGLAAEGDKVMLELIPCPIFACARDECCDGCCARGCVPVSQSLPFAEEIRSEDVQPGEPNPVIEVTSYSMSEAVVIPF
jgi:hypothetical protein